jgi:hypothetical protein
MKIFLRIPIIVLLIAFASCSKDRLEKDDFSAMDDFYNEHRQEEQEYLIDSGGTCPLIAKYQTRICLGKSALSLPDGSAFNYPWKLKVVELYSIKDMMLWPMHGMNGDSLLEISAMIRLRAFKDDTELKLRAGANYLVETDTLNPVNQNMLVHYGSQEPDMVNWTISNDTISTILSGPETYQMKLGALGWFMAARNAGATPFTNIRFTATGNNTQNIEVFLVLRNFKGLTKVSNLQSMPIPVGEQVTLFAMAKKSTGAYVLHKENFTVTAGMEKALEMEEVSEDALLAAMNDL